jgi:hypothetical protein
LLIEQIFGTKISTNTHNGAGFSKPSGTLIEIIPPSAFDPTKHFMFNLYRSENDGSGPLAVVVKQAGKPDYVHTVLAGANIVPGYNGSGNWVPKAAYNLLTSPVSIVLERSVPVFFNTDLKA